jgi:hypothetical protein
MLIPFTPAHRAFSMEFSGQRPTTGVNGISIKEEKPGDSRLFEHHPPCQRDEGTSFDSTRNSMPPRLATSCK